ncbi:MAG: hypothetical protein WBA45_06155 [Microthrixaceae bacterium]
MTDCADSTMLRSHLDHPDPALDRHLDDCEICAGLIRSIAQDAGLARRRIESLDADAESRAYQADSHTGQTDLDADFRAYQADSRAGQTAIDVEAALRIVRAKAPNEPPKTAAAPRPRRQVGLNRKVLLSAAAVLVVVVVAVTPQTRTAVAATLDAFRGERLQAVSVDFGSWSEGSVFAGLRALDSLGEVDTSGLSEPSVAANVAEAEAIAGITAPTLPDKPDRIVAMAPGVVHIVLASGDNGVPAALDGASLVVDTPGAIGAIYGPEDGPPLMVVGRSGTLRVRAEGAPLEEIRSFLLSREELPEDLRSQLADIDDWRSTIPVPIPIDGPGWKKVEVNDRPAIAFGDDSGLGTIVLRDDPDGATVVGGRIPVSRALEVAGGA